MRVKFKFYLLTCLALLLAIPLGLAPRAARAATITISDQDSCEREGGFWNDSHCTMFSYSVQAGDVLQVSVGVGMSFKALFNEGTIHFNAYTTVIDLVNKGTIHFNAGSLHHIITNDGVINFTHDVIIYHDFTNNGAMNITNGSVRLTDGMLLGSDHIGDNNGVINIGDQGQFQINHANAGLNNINTLNVNAGGTLENLGTVNNQGIVTVACGGVIEGDGSIQGNPVEVQTDCTPPTATPSQSPEANPAGWNTSDVTVDWNWSDNPGGSGIDAANCTASSTASGEGEITLNATCRDLAGNEGRASYTVKIDKTPPTLSAAAATPANASGWYNSGVTVQFTCSDGLSGIPDGACPADEVLSAEGASVSSTAQTVTDTAGNSSASSNVVTVQIDQSAPLVAVTGVIDDASYPLGSAPAPGCTTSDALSGVATEAGLSISGGDADGTGSFTVTCSGAEDNAGNVAAPVSVTYHVAYHWSGFFPPVENLPAVNSANAGQAIPIKFSLGGDYGLNIFAPGYPASQQVHCDSGDGEGNPIDETATPGASSLQYDPVFQTYTYVWKTDKAWAGTCRQLTVTLVDGTAHTALFQFKGKVRSASAEGDAARETGQDNRLFLPLVNR